jgi:hypothetical protein
MCPCLIVKGLSTDMSVGHIANETERSSLDHKLYVLGTETTK